MGGRSSCRNDFHGDGVQNKCHKGFNRARDKEQAIALTNG